MSGKKSPDLTLRALKLGACAFCAVAFTSCVPLVAGVAAGYIAREHWKPQAEAWESGGDPGGAYEEPAYDAHDDGGTGGYDEPVY